MDTYVGLEITANGHAEILFDRTEDGVTKRHRVAVPPNDTGKLNSLGLPDSEKQRILTAWASL